MGWDSVGAISKISYGNGGDEGEKVDFLIPFQLVLLPRIQHYICLLVLETPDSGEGCQKPMEQFERSYLNLEGRSKEQGQWTA